MDENLHAIGGSGIVRVAMKEQARSTYELAQFSQAVKEATDQVYLHECAIVDKIFENGKMDGITDLQLKRFVQSRLNLCLDYLGIERNYVVEYNPVGDWFYTGINNYQMNDFFQGVGREYQRDWDKTRFTWNPSKQIRS